ncbi:hypothetical protein SAMN02745857_02133 [Andreprevotia lacus DSM 23236]|jgi:hypothetical protein|uniref:Uncharacterized protein n=1 Tax=Andreprevotia lacus DSM 23236 TaxID=1121001 RepID=A0A1W1XMZ7_9NEIS|nr:hypothetical protein [Andreprevotia lacus]SMC25333.1 hypothetical protein SAMN02745857_02133 [Andreprevotia lacus DSM 23236]
MNNRKPTLLLAATLLALSTAAGAATLDELAYRWAPVHYQDTDSSDFASDYLTAVDYDGDWSGINNWDNRTRYPLKAAMYYSVVESCSHWFINYSFFHPRDWSDTIFDGEHENDLEGVLLAVRKDGSSYGKVDGMLTIFHTDFYAYTPAGSPLLNGHETIDGTLSFENDNGTLRPKTAAQSKGHGVKAWPYITDFTGAGNQDGVIYYPTQGDGGIPTSGNDRHVPYRLINIFQSGGMWTHALADAQISGKGTTFATWGTFRGDGGGGCGSGAKICTTDSAHAPWGWDDDNDGTSYRGEWALDPAHLFNFYFDGTTFSETYLSNQYLDDMRRMGWATGHVPAGYDNKADLSTMLNKLGSVCR